jgi:glycosyltransferase involved in cell wall biosynthesis
MTPEVSVVMPVRDGTSCDAVETVLSQTFTDLELLVIDDGSGNETSFISEEYARGDRWVHIIRQSATISRQPSATRPKTMTYGYDSQR